MDFAFYKQHILETPGRYDITPLFEDPELFTRLIADLLHLCGAAEIIAGIDAMGFSSAPPSHCDAASASSRYGKEENFPAKCSANPSPTTRGRERHSSSARLQSRRART